MKIATTYENGMIFQHFGHSEQFKIYDVEDGKIVSAEVIGTDGSGHCALASLLAERRIDALICGDIGGGARVALANMGIALYPGVIGPADEAVAALIAGKLDYNPNTVCSHHHHGEGHSCHHDHGSDCHGHTCHHE